MTTKAAKSEMIKAHEAAVAVLDAKIGNLPEWTVFRAINRALLALDAAEAESPPTPPSPPQNRLRARLNDGPTPYMTLADQALSKAGKPVTTTKIVEYIAQHRELSGHPDKVKIVIQSSLSKDERFKSVPWEGGRAWWYADKPVPNALARLITSPPK